MALHPATEQVMRLVEQTTGLPVIAQADPAMKNLASVKIASGSAPAHVVTYNPSVSANVNYTICFQCGFVLRTFMAPASERFDLGGTFRGLKQAERLAIEHLRQDKSLPLDRDARKQLAFQFYDGLIRQLRSMPIGMRVDDWLRRDYPDLADEQRAGAVVQLNQNTQALRGEVRRFAPPMILRANMGMNAALASFWSRAWGDPLLLSAYRATGFLDVGEELLRLWDEIPADPANDKKLIETWASKLDLGGWYELVPHA